MYRYIVYKKKNIENLLTNTWNIMRSNREPEFFVDDFRTNNFSITIQNLFCHLSQMIDNYW